ncbi:hypothetical protein A2397_06090 [Candidatus Amesbacteria bacterium RIFOXYB1_FULL_44_23]|uniref:Carrier domain-containing protein n=1 Tax=Candidatus Amesbacteria bacterium RIFOXYB1_FULL_44_23 TaxID=1797263 RepID=A0A1F4ZW68_9BACT|nr:MAG: hypothetical protein A2397_06090 [Candidatus Amesbacteria bacterium RIFOXYB1_FULL_44_23]
MNPNLSHAIMLFLANEFHMSPEDVLPDSDLALDFDLTPEQISDLLDRMQDALDFILPEDKIADIHTISDLLQALNPENEAHESD